MIFHYAYRDSGNVRHDGTIDAPSRDEVFRRLREKGIRPFVVELVPGFVNRLRSLGKRGWTIIVLALALVAVIVAGVCTRGGGQPGEQQGNSSYRHQIYGDPAVLERMEHGNFDGVLTNRLDVMLAWFAQPGKLMCPPHVDIRHLADAFAEAVKSSSGAVAVDRQAPREVRELVQIVNGLHDELAAYLANGNGTPQSYWRRLMARTTQECQIYERVRRELEGVTDAAVYEQKNEALRNIGLRTIPMPE